jgi:hypothetical protein
MLAAGLPVALTGCQSSGDTTSPTTGSTQSPTTVSTLSPTTRLTPSVTTTQTTTQVTPTPANPQQTATGTITAAANERFGAFGTEVAVDGGTALVGATDGPDGGVVVVFEKNSTWQRTTTISPDKASDAFGGAVAISNSNNVAVVGDRFADRGDRHNGLAYIFERTPEGWRQAKTIGPPSGRRDDPLFDGIGWSVDVAGGTVIVSAQREQTTMRSEVGSVQLFHQTDNGWERSETFTSRQKGYGWEVALPRSDRAAVGIPRVETTDGTGKVVILDHSGEGWIETATLSTAGNDQFGNTLAGDDTTLAVGTRSASNETNGARAYVHELVDGTWTQTRLDLAGVRSSVTPVAVAGNTAVVGMPGSGDQQGQAFVFTRSASEWSRQSRLVVNNATAAFGRTVAATRNTVLVATPDNSESGDQRDPIYVFNL